jgi:hypothetical protein
MKAKYIMLKPIIWDLLAHTKRMSNHAALFSCVVQASCLLDFRILLICNWYYHSGSQILIYISEENIDLTIPGVFSSVNNKGKKLLKVESKWTVFQFHFIVLSDVLIFEDCCQPHYKSLSDIERSWNVIFKCPAPQVAWVCPHLIVVVVGVNCF